MSLSWTQAICANCWNAKNPGREASRVIGERRDTCAYCGRAATAGIYVRDDPANVAHPRPKE